MAFVFLYGPNTCTSRLNSQQLLNGEAQIVGKAQTVENYDIIFDVYIESNKCGAVNIKLFEGRKVWGVVYKIPDALLKDRDERNSRITLPQIVGLRYYKKNILVEKFDGEIVKVITFVAKERYRHSAGISTSSDYLYWIIAGLKEHNIPQEYIDHIRETAIASNEKAINNIRNEIELIKKLH